MKSEIKKQMLTFAIGILLGAIIATGVFLVLKSNNSNGNGNFNDRPAMTEGERPSGERESRSKSQSSETTDNSQTTESSETTETTN